MKPLLNAQHRVTIVCFAHVSLCSLILRRAYYVSLQGFMLCCQPHGDFDNLQRSVDSKRPSKNPRKKWRSQTKRFGAAVLSKGTWRWRLLQKLDHLRHKEEQPQFHRHWTQGFSRWTWRIWEARQVVNNSINSSNQSTITVASYRQPGPNVAAGTPAAKRPE